MKGGVSLNGSKIKALMDERGISFRELSDMTGISKSTLQRHAAGLTKNVPIEAMEKIAAALGTSVGDLLGFSVESNIDDLKREIAETEAALAFCSSSEEREELEFSLAVMRESLEDTEIALMLRNAAAKAPADDLTQEQRDFLALVPTLTPEEISVLASTAKALKAARRDPDRPE
jgi:DNA-binding Xre family transcriptional regulator